MMKNLYKLLFIILMIFVVSACTNNDDKFQVIINDNISTEIYLGETEVDFKPYFIIKDKNGEVVEVIDSMIDASEVNFNKEGNYKVKLIYQEIEKEIEITVVKKISLTYTIIINEEVSTDITIGNSNIDFKQYFTIKDSDENTIEVLDSMIDATNVNLNKEGSYKIKITYLNVSEEIEIKIVSVEPQISYEIIIDENYPTTIEVGVGTIDFKQYFQIIDSTGNNIEVKDEMIDVSNVDVSTVGKFTIIINFNSLHKELQFNVIAKDDNKNSLDLFISEYSEGKNYDKYIEIFNGTGKAIDLANYSVALFNDSKEPAQYKLNLSGILKDGEILIIYNPSASALIKSSGNIAHKVIEFNGNDVIALYKDEILIDIVGNLNNPVVVGWDVGDVKEATKDHTLIRKSTVYGPNKSWAADEWIVLDFEDYSNIKKHVMDNYQAIKDEDDPVDTPKERIVDIFISEYFEGIGEHNNSKYIEIYNGLGNDVNLEAYSLAVYKSGLSNPSNIQPLKGVLKDKDVYIVYAPYSADEIKNKGHLASEVCYFNGNAVIALLKNDEVIDVIGTIGEYPDGGWMVDEYSTTANNTLIRKENINSPTDKWNPNEWYPCYENYLYGLGYHYQEDNEEIVYENFDYIYSMMKDLELDSKGTATGEYPIKVKGTVYIDVKAETTLVYLTDGKNFIKLHGEKIHNFTTPGLVYEIVCYYKAYLYQPTLEVLNPSEDIKKLTDQTLITEVEVKEVTLTEVLALKKENFALNITNGYLQSILKISGYLQLDTHNSTRYDYCLTADEKYAKNITGYIDNGLYFKNDVEDLEADLIDYEVIKDDLNIEINIYGVIYDWNPNRSNWRIYVAEDITIYYLNN